MYRPTVRYDDRFKDYVDELFAATNLDRNQIMRLALFLLGHSKEGKDVLTFFSTSSLPEPNWDKNNTVLWYGKESNFTFSDEEGAWTSNVINNQNSIPRPEGATARRNDGKVCDETEEKPIIFKLGNSILLPR